MGRAAPPGGSGRRGRRCGRPGRSAATTHAAVRRPGPPSLAAAGPLAGGFHRRLRAGTPLRATVRTAARAIAAAVAAVSGQPGRAAAPDPPPPGPSRGGGRRCPRPASLGRALRRAAPDGPRESGAEPWRPLREGAECPPAPRVRALEARVRSGVPAATRARGQLAASLRWAVGRRGIARGRPVQWTVLHCLWYVCGGKGGRAGELRSKIALVILCFLIPPPPSGSFPPSLRCQRCAASRRASRCSQSQSQRGGSPHGGVKGCFGGKFGPVSAHHSSRVRWWGYGHPSLAQESTV